MIDDDDNDIDDDVDETRVPTGPPDIEELFGKPVVTDGVRADTALHADDEQPADPSALAEGNRERKGE